MSASRSSGTRLGLAFWIVALGVGAASAWVLSMLARAQNPDLLRYAALSLALALAPLALWCRGRWRRVLIAVVLLSYGYATFDAAAALLSNRRNTPTVTVAGRRGSFQVRDRLLGFGPPRGVVAEAGTSRQGGPVRRVRYSIDGDGFRVTPGPATARGDTVVFLGCSVTFGDGLGDRETLPSQYLAAHPGPVNVVNAAFSGYGTHQVVHQLASERLRARLTRGRRVFVYSALVEHLRRNQGRTTWDAWGPRYVLEGGALRYRGPFHSELGGRFRQVLWSSALIGPLMRRWLKEPRPVPEAVRLYGALVGEAQSLAARRFGARFIVVLWDVPSQADTRSPSEAATHARLAQGMATEMNGRGVPFLRVSELIPDYRANMAVYLGPDHIHPTALLNRRLAEQLAKRI